MANIPLGLPIPNIDAHNRPTVAKCRRTDSASGLHSLITTSTRAFINPSTGACPATVPFVDPYDPVHGAMLSSATFLRVMKAPCTVPPEHLMTLKYMVNLHGFPVP